MWQWQLFLRAATKVADNIAMIISDDLRPSAPIFELNEAIATLRRPNIDTDTYPDSGHIRAALDQAAIAGAILRQCSS